MPFERKRSPLILTAEERKDLTELRASRNAPHGKVVRASILLDYADGRAIHAIAGSVGKSRPTVERCVDKALAGGVKMALSDLPRKGCPGRITTEDRFWVANVACKKPFELGYAQEVWTFSLLAAHVCKHATQEGHPALARATKSMLHDILEHAEIKPHKFNYYLERRDPEFDVKMAQVLAVYKEVAVAREQEAQGATGRAWTVISYDEKPGMQALDHTAPDLPPVTGKHETWGRDYEYVRKGTLTLLAGIDLHDGRVIGLVRERHRSQEFTEFLAEVNQAYPADWKLRIILDNHSAHISKETMKWLTEHANRFEFTFTPKHGSWLNIVETFFSKMTRSFLRYLRAKSKEELKQRIEQWLRQVNEDPVVFHWSYKIDDAQV